MNKYKILLFDLDDTLIDNSENVKYAFTKILEYMGESYSEEKFKKWYELDKQFWIDFHHKKIEVPEELKAPGKQEEFVRYVRSLRYILYFENKISLEKSFEINKIFLESLNEIVVPIDGVYETLSYLNKKYEIVITTNGPTSAVSSKLEKIDCLKFIKASFSADMTANTVTKPSVEYYQELKDFINYHDNSSMLIIGNSLREDVQGGMNMGIDSCWFNRLDEELLDNYKPTFIIRKLTDLKDRL